MAAHVARPADWEHDPETTPHRLGVAILNGVAYIEPAETTERMARLVAATKASPSYRHTGFELGAL